MSKVEYPAPALHANGSRAHRAVRDPGGGSPTARGKPRGRFRPDVDPLPVGVVAVGGAELMASIQLAREAWHLGGAARDAAFARAVQAGALLVSARRAGARGPLITSLIFLRVLGLVAHLAADSPSKRPGRRPNVALVLWLIALGQLRREAARAEAWNM